MLSTNYDNKVCSIVVEPNPTGIKEIDNCEVVKSSNSQIFNVAGQRLDKMQKGVNIVNGKKILIP